MSNRIADDRRLGGLDVTAVVVGGIVGVGIFFTPSGVAKELMSPVAVMAVWMLGGLIAMLGALVLAELGGLLPEAGGFYVFLREGFGRVGSLVAFLYGWVNLVVVQTGALAIIALVLAQNIEVLTGPLSEPVRIAIAMTSIATFAGANAVGLRTGAGVQRAVTAFKLLAVLALCGIGVGWGSPSELMVAPVRPASGWLAALGAALVPVLFSFGGWQHGTYVAGRTENPQRNVPLGIAAGMGIVVVVYLAINLAYLSVLGQEGVAQSQTVGADAASKALGPLAGKAVAVAIVLSAAGILNTITLAFPYVLVAMARDGVFVGAAGRLDARTGTPLAAIGALAMLAMLYTTFGTSRIETLLAGLAFAEWSFFAAVSAAHLVLRRRFAATPRPFRAPAPVAFGFLAVSTGIALGALLVKPHESVFGLVALAVGGLVYAVATRSVGARSVSA